MRLQAEQMMFLGGAAFFLCKCGKKRIAKRGKSWEKEVRAERSEQSERRLL